MDATNEEPTMPTPKTEPSKLDAACRLMTGWKSWAEMHADLTKNNASYAPTLRDDDNAAPLPEHKAAIALIRAACDSAGFRWYDGERLHNATKPSRKAA